MGTLVLLAREEIIKSIIISIVMKRIVYLKEFMKGLALFDLARLIVTYPEICKPLFVNDSQSHDSVDANYVFSIMVPEYSPEGSSRRCLEESIMDHFQDFLFKLEDEQISCNTTTDTFHNSVAFSNADNPNDDGAVVETDGRFSQPSLSPAGVMGWLFG